ncbi:MAG TPA: glycosyltransferase family 2 protein [Terriglobales bacterium]|nr:glycosyltransferase family 2 protein [Terriglobales bacterium]
MGAASTISIAMCTCNGEAHLKEQLESILEQTLLPNEVIVSDDASTDGTVEIVSSFKQKCPFPIKILVNKSRLGVCKNFENAIRHCSGEIIFLADQDDIWMPTKIATIMAAFESHPSCGYVFSNAELIDGQGNDMGRDLWTSLEFDEKRQARYGRGEQLCVMLRLFTLAYGMTMAFRAALSPRLMPFECRFFHAIVHDGWISLFLSSLGAYGVALPSSLVKYRQHEKQLASAGKRLGFLDLVTTARSDSTQANMEFAEVLDVLAARLEQLDQTNHSVSWAREQLRAKATHLRARVHANSSHGVKRLKIVFREAISGRYRRYSRSFKSIVKDLVQADQL